MPYHFWIVLAVLAAVPFGLAYLSRRRPTVDYAEKIGELRKEMEDIKPKPKKIKFYGGPLNDKEDQVLQESPFGFIQYTPDESDEGRQQIGEIMGQPVFAPKIAYYSLIEPGQYLYVRDVSEEEARTASRTGVPPSPVVENTE